VFAMGGSPILALSIAAFPESLPTETVAAIFAAADGQVRAAGALLAGGHTIRDEEPKYGLAVIGTVHPDGLWPKSGARPGDTLFVTKPLGTGLIMTGFKRGVAGTQQLERAVRWMTTLNNDAADVLRSFEPNAVTDVTGFGLFGHAHEMAERSGVRITLESERSPAAASFSGAGTGVIARRAGSSTRLRTRMPWTNTTVPPSHPPSVSTPKPINVRTSEPPVTSPST
jgi:selenide,water dikinase